MRIANLDGRLVLIVDGGYVDVAEASDGKFDSDPQLAFDDWEALLAWAERCQVAPSRLDEQRLQLPVPRPSQVFAIGLNYAAHAAEGGQPPPSHPPTFTKFPSCLAGPNAVIDLPTASVDWEVELVVVMSRRAYKVSRDDAWSHVAGLTVGQDLSERSVQLRPPMPQFSLGKSYPGFGPIGPWIVTPDELDDPDDLTIECSLNGEVMQESRTSKLIFGVPALIEELSAVTPLNPGDLIFTGTPHGVGFARTPPRFIEPGDVLLSTIGGIGSLRTRFSPTSTATPAS